MEYGGYSKFRSLNTPGRRALFFRGRFNWFSENIGALEILSVPERSPTAWLSLAVSERLKGLQLRATTAVQHLALCVLKSLAVSGKVLAGFCGQSYKSLLAVRIGL